MHMIETFCIAGLFAVICVFGEKRLPDHRVQKGRALSAQVGAALTYVFVRLLPKRARAGQTSVESTAGRSLS